MDTHINPTHILLIHIFSTCFMTGLIWCIQLVHYPSFKFYTEQNFKEAHKRHNKSISCIVLPVMLIELVTGIYLYLALRDNAYFQWVGLNLLGLTGIWLSTFFIQVPHHRAMEKEGFVPKLIDNLVNWNWIRTVLWSLRALLMLWVISSIVG